MWSRFVSSFFSFSLFKAFTTLGENFAPGEHSHEYLAASDQVILVDTSKQCPSCKPVIPSEHTDEAMEDFLNTADDPACE